MDAFDQFIKADHSMAPCHAVSGNGCVVGRYAATAGLFRPSFAQSKNKHRAIFPAISHLPPGPLVQPKPACCLPHYQPTSIFTIPQPSYRHYHPDEG